VLAIALAPAPAASGAGVEHPSPAPTRVLQDATGPGPVDIVRTSVVQEHDQLVWRTTTARTWRTADLRAGIGRRICLSTHRESGAEASRLCVGAHGDRLRARVATIDAHGLPTRWEASPATVRRPDPHTVEVRGPVATLGRATGTVRWSASSSWIGGRDCPAAGDCVDRAPSTEGRFATYETRHAVPVGCVAGGPETVTHGPAAGRRVALTFDDGPWELTSRFLDVLHHERVPATFFVNGVNFGGRTALLRRMVREGHAIGNHTWSHANVAGGGRGQIVSNQHAIEHATGFRPCVFRPPYGATSGALAAQLRSLGLIDVLWSVDTNDWRLPGAGTVASRALAVRPGGIVLMHDGGGPRGGTLAALPTIIHGLKARGYHLVTVPELLGLPQRWRYRSAG